MAASIRPSTGHVRRHDLLVDEDLPTIRERCAGMWRIGRVQAGRVLARSSVCFYGRGRVWRREGRRVEVIAAAFIAGRSALGACPDSTSRRRRWIRISGIRS